MRRIRGGVFQSLGGVTLAPGGPNGKETLADLFDGRSQPIAQHLVFGPDWGRAASAARSAPIMSAARASISSTTIVPVGNLGSA